MRNRTIIAVLCCLMLALPGCKGVTQETFQIDTVVQIPVDPEETKIAQTGETEPAAQTEAPAETQPEETEATAPAKSSGKTSTGKSSSSSGKSSSSSGKNSGSSSKKDKNETVKEITPPETEATKPPETVPQETVPPETEDPAAAIYDISDYAVGSIAYTFLDEINACRAEAELDALSLDGRLSAIASVRAYEASVSWSSTRPDGRGGASVLGDYGYGYGSTAEHLCYASGSGDASAIVAKWMDSDAHRQNILSESFTKLGVGEYHSGGTTCVAVIFVG